MTILNVLSIKPIKLPKNDSATDEDDWYIPSVDKIKKELGCNITLNLTESIRKIIY